MKLPFFTLAALLFLAACTDTATSNEQGIVSDVPAKTETSQEQTNNGAASNAEVPTSSDLYEIKVLNDSIKSPRKEMTGKLGDTEITVNYGSPAVKGRTIYGDLIPYGRVWRTGANEATRITFSAPVMLGGEQVPAGTYSLFTEPASKNNWTVIINKVADQWGNYDYDESKDVARVAVVGSATPVPFEHLEFTMTAAGLAMHWADLTVTIPVTEA